MQLNRNGKSLAMALALAMAAWCCSVGVTSAAGKPKPINFESRNGRIYANGKDFIFKGINWFGMDTNANVIHGLWGNGPVYTDILDFLQKQNFNGLRLPFNIESVNKDTKIQDKYLNKANTAFKGKTYLQGMDMLFKEAAKRNILVILDYQMLHPGKGIPDLWDNGNAKDKADVLKAWKTLANRFCSQWNVVAADIKNEPHGVAEWGTKNKAKDWVLGAQELGNAVLKVCPRWMVWVEGVDSNVAGVPASRKHYTGFWGSRLDGVQKHPVKLSNNKRLVYSPHVYGPSVFQMSYFKDKNYPKNLEKNVWEPDFGKVPTWGAKNGMIIGEWGGTYEGNDIPYQDTLMAYIKKKKLGAFYWCVNPNSHDTKGIFKDDWKTPVASKIKLLSKQPFTPVKSVSG